MSNFLKVRIAGNLLDVNDDQDSPVSISYNLEDAQNFQDKGSAQAFQIATPATLNNQRAANSFHNPNIEDMTADKIYTTPQPASIIAGVDEIFTGKALLSEATAQAAPGTYVWDMLGQNGDWLIAMQELTLWDCLPTATHIFNQANAIASWQNGASFPIPTLEYVYAPVRYLNKFGGADGNDTNVLLMDLRPSLYVWPLIQRAFASVGYTVISDFMSSAYFRRLVMPWVWGDFLKINSKLADNLKFKATGNIKYSPITGEPAVGVYGWFTKTNSSGSGYIFPGVGNSNGNDFDLSNTLPIYGYDNNGNYSYDAINGVSNWTYKPPNGISFGTITARFGIRTAGGVYASNNSNASIYIDIYKNGVLQQSKQQYNASAGATSDRYDQDNGGYRQYNFSLSGLNPNDVIGVKFRWIGNKSGLGGNGWSLYSWDYQAQGNTFFNNGTAFELYGISIDPGGVVDFKQYDRFKNYKFLDKLRGLVDLFDLQPQTDSTSRIIRIEPTYPYLLSDDTSTGIGIVDGYFQTARRLDWNDKQDISTENTNTLFSDSERELNFKFKADGSNGGVNIYNNRYSIEAGLSKYLLGKRFKKGKKDNENRFFSAPMHYNADQFKSISGNSPQMMCFIPENVSNTSAEASENNFEPVLAYYKGYMNPGVFATNVGGWRFEGLTTYFYPYMFAVNYKPGGQYDPILVYNDVRVLTNTAGVYALGRGLLKRFFLNRMAVWELGKLYKPKIRLTNNDITNWFHREGIMIKGAVYFIIGFDKYVPLKPEPVEVSMWKYIRPSTANEANVYPSSTSVLTQPTTLPSDDIKYADLLLFTPDIP